MRQNKIKYLVIALCFALISGPAFGWGIKGHDIVAAIATNNLKPGAEKKLKKILDDRSLMYYSSWMDFIRKDSAYRYTSTWHYANIDAGETYETMPKNPNGDVCTAVNDIVGKLRAGGCPTASKRCT